MELFVLSTDYIAWKGRYCANDYATFDNFLLYVFAQSMKQSPPGPDPWDTTVDTDAIGNNSIYFISSLFSSLFSKFVGCICS